MHEELAPFGIEVSAVCPGSFRTDFRDASSMRMPSKPMTEYKDSPVNDVKEFLNNKNHKQEGDPQKAAALIWEMVQREDLPRRILIGEKCCEQVKVDLLSQLEEIEIYHEASSKTDFAD